VVEAMKATNSPLALMLGPMAWTSGTEISVNDGPCPVAACPRLMVLPSIETWSSVSVLPSSTLICPMATSAEPLSMLEPATSSVPSPPISPPSIREHLHGNAGLVHRLQSSLADLGQEFERVRAVRRYLSRPEAPAADCAWIDSADQGWNRKMLFERHDTH
jgi:hypothetical protein